jgi:NAD(P)-dependent dehydrogenase (short-subunit alcohol dehydrogenase family)
MRRAVVTGGNRGLGLETCRQLAKRGFEVVLTSRDLAEGRARARELAAEGRVEAAELDVADPASIARFAETMRDVDVLVNNAGISQHGFDATVAKTTLEVNFFGAMRVTDALLPKLGEPAVIVMVSSGLGESDIVSPPLRVRFLDPQLDRDSLVALMREFIAAVERGDHQRKGWPSSAYGVSKLGMNALVRVLARELEPRRISINAVCPGWVRTDMGGSSAPRSVKQGADGIVWAATLGEDGPTGRWFRDREEIDW